MPITTTAEVKVLLQIPNADTSKDTLISSLIVIVQDFIVRRINNFAIPNSFIESYWPTFTASDKSINDATIDFREYGFVAGNEILVSGSYQNNKIFTIVSVAEHKIIVTETVKDEESTTRVIIKRIEFTDDIKLASTDFIASKMNRDKTVKSRSLGDHSESFFTPEEMLSTFDPFKKLNWD